MKQHPENPILRWRDRLPGREAPEDRAAVLIRGSLVPGGLDDRQLARVEERVRSRRQYRSPRVFRLALVALFLVVAVATVEAARRAGWLDRILPLPVPARAPLPGQPAKVALAAPAGATDSRPLDADEAVAPAPSLTEAVPSTEIAPPRRQARGSHRAVSIDSPVPPATAPSEEIRALDQAIGQLRRDRNAGAALSTLDAYLARYPHGVLNREARLARVDALLMLQRMNEALTALETLPLDTHRRSNELQVIRGELRARADCARAEEDYSAVLARNPDAVLAERALYDRGACRAKRGDRTGASVDLRRYLERFPNGAHAAWARQWMEMSGNSLQKGG
jgi:hypothetical protein